MTDNRKTTVPGASVGADAVQSSSKINTNIITNSGKQINLQAAKKSNNFGLNTVSMTELYDTVYPPRRPIVNDLLYSGTYLFVGAPKVGKSFFMGQLAYHVAMGLPLWEYEVHQGTVLYLWHWRTITPGCSGGSPGCSGWRRPAISTSQRRPSP